MTDFPARPIRTVARPPEIMAAPEAAGRSKPVGLDAILRQPGVLPVHREIVLIALARGIKQDQLARMYNAADPAQPKRFTGATIHEQLARTRTGLSQRSRARYAKALGLEPDHLELADCARPLTDERVHYWRTTLREECTRRAAEFDAGEILANFDALDASLQQRLLRAFALGMRRANLELVNPLPEYGISAQARLPVRGLDHMLEVAERAGCHLGTGSEKLQTPLGDGRWWNSRSAATRADVMVGAASAFASGFSAGLERAITGLQRLIATNDTLSREQRAALSNAMLSFLHAASRPRFSEGTIGAYVDRVSAYYAAHPEAAGTEFGDVLACVHDEPAESPDARAERFVNERTND